jgi:DNA-nicking Smr family endonuclease
VEESEEDIFLQAMSDVRPIDREAKVEKAVTLRAAKALNDAPDADVHRELTRLLESGRGFVIANTPEYMEGTGYNVDKSIARRLHRGEFAIEDYIDLHGHTVEAAEAAFDAFLKRALAKGKRAVLVVHGRGLSSPGKPVLKSKVKEWLTLGPWRKWVMAFSSAQSYDGGVGATYVLLRKHPVTTRGRTGPRG